MNLIRPHIMFKNRLVNILESKYKSYDDYIYRLVKSLPETKDKYWTKKTGKHKKNWTVLKEKDCKTYCRFNIESNIFTNNFETRKEIYTVYIYKKLKYSKKWGTDQVRIKIVNTNPSKSWDGKIEAWFNMDIENTNRTIANKKEIKEAIDYIKSIVYSTVRTFQFPG